MAASYNNLGLVLQDQGDLKGAKEYYEKALKIKIACYGTENHTNVADSYNNLGNVLRDQGDLKGAKEYYEKALKIKIACYGTEKHTVVANSYNNLGLVLKAQGDLKLAKEYYEKALKIKIACYGTEEHTDVAASYNNLGLVLQGPRRSETCQGVLRKSAENQDRLLRNGRAHRRGRQLQQLRDVLKDQGDLKGAKEYYEKALRIKIACYGTEEHTDVAISYMNIGDVYFELKQFDQARDSYSKAKQCNHRTNGTRYDAFYDKKIQACKTS